MRLCTVSLAIAASLALAGGQRLQADADRIWFGPAPGALDYRELFERPEEWARARALVNVFQFHTNPLWELFRRLRGSLGGNTGTAVPRGGNL